MQILIVDDTAANRKLLCQMLSHCGYSNAIEATSGLEAIEIIKQQNIDIVMMDVMMPEMNGYETTKIIKQYAGDNHIPIIFVTALSGEQALKEALECGGDDYIGKPLNLDIVESKVRAHSRIRELTQQLHVKNSELLNHNQHLQHEHELVSYFFDNALARSYMDKRCIRCHFSPMSAFNGDLMLSRRSPCGGLYLLLGDFTGHGLTAAMGTLPVAQAFFEFTKKDLCVGDLAKKLNATLNKLLPEELFFAATIIEISASGLKLELWNGGLPSSVIVSEDGSQVNPISSQHMPLGILDESEFDANAIQCTLNKNDRLLLYTDGIIEAKNPQGEEFGEQRLQDLFTKTGDHLFDAVNDELTRFRNNPDQQDDISLVEILCDQLPEIDTSSAETDSCNNRLPWHFSTTLESEDIRTINPVSSLVDTLDAALSLGKHKGLIYTILSEAYNNSLDHSILGLHKSTDNDDDLLNYYNQREQALSELKDAYIKFSIEFTPNKDAGSLLIILQDSGNHAQDFSFDKEIEKRKKDNWEAAHGRGLVILSELCTVLKIDAQQRRIELEYQL